MGSPGSGRLACSWMSPVRFHLAHVQNGRDRPGWPWVTVYQRLVVRVLSSDVCAAHDRTHHADLRTTPIGPRRQAQHLYRCLRSGAQRPQTVLMVRRADDGSWELPGGRIQVSESASAARVRGVGEQTGVTITITGLAGVYSDPTHMLAYPRGKGVPTSGSGCCTP